MRADLVLPDTTTVEAMAHLITGAGSGIGAAVARILHDRGDDLVLVARSEERAGELVAEFPGAVGVVVDLAGPELAEQLAHQLAEQDWGTLDSVIHVAGVVDLVPVADLTQADLLGALQVNLVAPSVLTSLTLPHLRATRGTVVFVNSTAALAVNPTWASYAASKAGLRAIADALRAEEAPHGVRVTTVFPSRTATAMQQRVREQEGADYDPSRYLDPATVAAAIVSVLDLPRDATVPEITLRPGPR